MKLAPHGKSWIRHWFSCILGKCSFLNSKWQIHWKFALLNLTSFLFPFVVCDSSCWECCADDPNSCTSCPDGFHLKKSGDKMHSSICLRLDPDDNRKLLENQDIELGSCERNYALFVVKDLMSILLTFCCHCHDSFWNQSSTIVGTTERTLVGSLD